MDDISMDDERHREVSKTLRNVKCCNPLNWNGPSAHEVHDGLFIGNGHAAKNVGYLTDLGITHLLNAAHPGPSCTMSVPTDPQILEESNICYMGLQLSDDNSQEIFSTFETSGKWIEKALLGQNSKVLINCWAGCSRSATIALAFLVFTYLVHNNKIENFFPGET